MFNKKCESFSLVSQIRTDLYQKKNYFVFQKMSKKSVWYLLKKARKEVMAGHWNLIILELCSEEFSNLFLLI